MRSNARRIAFGGVFASVAVVIMCLGGYIPFATYICPMLCCMTQAVVFYLCGRTIAWTWFAVVCFLSLLLTPDKEAAMVFLAIGFYPILKPTFEKIPGSLILKLLYFNSAIVMVYFVMISLFGMKQLAEENMELGLVGLVILLILGNLAFILLDKFLTILYRRIR